LDYGTESTTGTDEAILNFVAFKPKLIADFPTLEHLVSDGRHISEFFRG
jgi:hypothetical protein